MHWCAYGLEALGYTYEGGERWKPPLGPSAAPMLDNTRRLGMALAALFEAYEGVFDMAMPHPHQSERAKLAEQLARDTLRATGNN